MAFVTPDNRIRYETPKNFPIPEGTQRYQRSEDEHGADTFGVSEMLETSNDGNVLVRFSNRTRSSDGKGEIKVRLPKEKASDATTLNDIGAAVQAYLTAEAQHFAIPEIVNPAEGLEAHLTLLLTGASRTGPAATETQRFVRDTLAQLGVLQENLIKSDARVSKEMLTAIETLSELGVLYFTSPDGNTIRLVSEPYRAGTGLVDHPVNGTLNHYREILRKASERASRFVQEA